MRIDLPTCALKTCKHYIHGNCGNTKGYNTCEYTLLKNTKDRVLKELKKECKINEGTLKIAEIECDIRNIDYFDGVDTGLNKAINIIEEEMK